MTREEYIRRWTRQLRGEFAGFAFHKSGPGLEERLSDFMDWIERTVRTMADESKTIDWPKLVTEPGANGAPTTTDRKENAPRKG